MFEPGTKVMVVASSSTKSVGARHGSVGYVVYCSYPEYFTNLRVADASMLVAPAEIAFIRYGFGKERERHERKIILIAFPIFPKSDNKEPIKNKVDAFLKKFKREKFGESLWYNTKSLFYEYPDSIDVCVVAPYPPRESNLLNCSNVEFGAWFDSVLSDKLLQATLAKVQRMQYAHKFPGDIRVNFADLGEASRRKTSKEALAKMLSNSPKVKKSMITAIRVLQSTGISGSRKSERTSVKQSFQNGFYHIGKQGKIKPTFYRMYVERLFNSLAFKLIDEVFHNYAIKDKEYISSSIKDTRDALQDMASTLSCK